MTAQGGICPGCTIKMQRILAEALGIDLAGKINWQEEPKPMWVGSAEAARLLDISLVTLSEWRKSGKLNCKWRKDGRGWKYWYADLEK